VLLPIGCTSLIIYCYYFVGAKARYRFYGALLGGSIILSAFLLFTLHFNYACLRSTVVCFVQAPTVTLSAEETTISVHQPHQFVSHLNLYGDIYTLDKYCADIELVWNFGDGTTTTKSGCDSYPPHMQPTTRGWVKHTYAMPGEYTITSQVHVRQRVLSHSTLTIVAR
jgi:hypothetical protein